jgi:hypothetical protein
MSNKDFENHNKVLNLLKESQSNEDEQRQAARDAKLFLIKRDGQWDPYAIEALEGRYRGTFDMCTPIVDQISGEIDQSDFTMKISPSGGDASIDTAQTLEGLLRNILNISNAKEIFSAASRSNVIGGFDAWEIVTDWIDGDSFDQDLFIRKIANAIDSVWFDMDSIQQDRSDAKWGWKLVRKTKDEYDRMWPDGSGQSIGDNTHANAYDNKGEFITVGQFYYKKKVKIDIVKMTDGSVHKVDEKFLKVQDELAAQGITIEVDNDGNEKRRTRKSWRVWSRLFDGGDWLQPEEETVFDYIPLIPIYGNFDIFENKPIYYGKLEKLFDQQRILNYAMSRDIEDGALSPSPAIWMTNTQAEGNDYSTMNTDNDPVRFYNPDPEAPMMPQTIGGPQVSSGLQATIAQSKEMILASSNSFNALQGNAMPQQSGIAGAQQIEQANIGSIKWFKPLQIAECHTAKILVNAVPRVYDGARQARILEEDGTSSIIPLNATIFDEQTQTNVELNDLSIGEYDVVCDYGPAFNSQQKETAQAFLDIASIDPTVIQQGKDILLKNLAVPGMDQMAERARIEGINNGSIPEKQWTDEERQEIQQAQAAAAQQEQQPDPMMIAAQAEMQKAQAEQMNAQNKQSEIQGNQQLKGQELQLSMAELQLRQQEFDRQSSDKFNLEAAKISQGQEKLDQSAMKMQMDQQNQQFNQQLSIMKQQMDEMTAAVNNMKTIREAAGVDTIVGPGVVDNFKTQSDIVSDEQDDIE